MRGKVIISVEDTIIEYDTVCSFEVIDSWYFVHVFGEIVMSSLLDSLYDLRAFSKYDMSIGVPYFYY